MCVVLFGSNSLKMSVLFYKNSDKRFFVQQFSVQQHSWTLPVGYSLYSGTKLSSKFQLKDQAKKDPQHVVYYVKCPEEQCTEDYTGETGRRLIERVKDHSGKD